MVETEFSGDETHNHFIKGHFFLIPDPETLDIFMQAAGRE
jgi:hypothetical protein